MTLARFLGHLFVLIAVFLAATASSVAGQQTATLSLDLDALFAGRDWNADSLGPLRWLDGDGYVRLEPSPTRAGSEDLARYEVATGERTLLVQASELVPPFGSGPLRVEDYDLSPNGKLLLIFSNSRRVWRTNSRGDYWLFDLESRTLTKIDERAPEASLMFAKFSPDSSRVAYVRDNDLWLQDLRTGSVTRLTIGGSPTLANGTTDWVYEEELGLRDGFRWSPDGRWIAFWQLDDSMVREFVLVDDTSDLYPTLSRFPYPKAGEVNPAARIGIVSAGAGPVVWMRLPGSARDGYAARMDWAAGSDQLIIQQLNRRQDTNRVFLADADDGEVHEILRETDEAWVDVHDDLRWVDSGRSFIWSSERDGWRRLYRVGRDGRQVVPLTPEGVDVIALESVDEEDGWIYYAAAPGEPTRRYLFRAPLAGRPEAAERLTPETPGTHTYSLAPGAGFALHTFSTFTMPPVVELVALPEHAPLRPLVDNVPLRERVEGLTIDHEMFRIAIEAGVELDGWALYPPDFDPSRKYPVLVHVYGEPAGQTVLDRWGGARLLWHTWLTRQGYVVISFDNRGTPAPRGRAWRKVVYGEVGTLASQDQAAALHALAAERPWIDLERIGVWGWSGGGSMTLNLMFRYPELYSTGMSVAPVPDQRYYDSIYQERYMGTPQDNPEGYSKGSPIGYASRLQGDLLIVHGTGDDNVHYQGTEALIDRLVEYGKPFTMMAYPNRTHAIREGAGTTRHLYGLLSRYLLENLPPGPR